MASVLRRLLGIGHPPAAVQRVSIIICSVDDERFRQVAENYAQRMGDWPYELIRICDATSLADGYNRGISQSTGELLIFSHDDIEILTPDFRNRLLAHLETFDLVGVAGTSRLMDGSWNSAGQPWVHGQCLWPARSGDGFTVDIYGRATQLVRPDIQGLDGLFLATRRGVAESLRFDAKTFDAFHLYDIDFSYRAYLAGLRVGVCNDILIYHQSYGNFDDVWRRHLERFQKKFAGALSTGAPGIRELHAREPVRSKDEALILFAYYLRQCGLAEAKP